jgi:hypothetical protein
MSGARGPLSPDAQSRRRRRLAWVVPIVVGLPLIALLVVALRVGWELGAMYIGFLVVVAVVGVLLHRAEQRKRSVGAPVDPAARADPALDTDKVEAALAQGGTLAGVREVRRQAPWLSLGEAAALLDRFER